MKSENLDSTIKEAFGEIYEDLEKLVYIANNANVFNHVEVRRIENSIKQNIKAIEYLIVSKNL
ncbi:hypothetical protein [Metabacillus fastidiosus]|uniref:Uncharacterized protein n=1 Tax=Metabacillus fastidiosus TaxID=1458 RepID=A0ABU6NU17_9BACI|nr:hypothetical protein [Metabacillus fastidiosus]MEC2075904.1 hypothetical protein [Metabacillus fastidiosus]MED4400635.1 hypothetical protein [Metabacillus fastidiosus]MED4453790.1 hypothetical protein [Metabacillus fastidiosus]MED4462806.1 hypothetical protein [Metabacillus fastidiosus]MED4532118.1 hypothetical protein [Metabacillus fastidiosus]